jgi:tetratricopeptide (TPR) repeat protein
MPATSIQDALNAALQHHRSGRITEAEAVYREILRHDPQQPDALNLLGLLAKDSGRPALAAELIAGAIQSNPNIAQFHANLGEVHRMLGKFELAAESMQCAIQLDPNSSDYHNTLGVTLKSLGKSADAIASFSRAIALDLAYSNAHFNLATALAEARDFPRAIAQWKKYLELNPHDADACAQLGSCLMWFGKLQEAEATCNWAISINPRSADAHNNLAACLSQQGRLDEAIAACRKAIEISPDHPGAHGNLGAALTDRGDFAGAIDHLSRALQLRPDLDEAHWNLAMAYLRQGDFVNGWPQYEWRLKNYWAVVKSKFTQPRWDGGDLHGKTILIHAEQGLGDTIQFVRYIPMVAARGGRIIFACPKELTRLLKNIPHISEIITPGERPSPFDVYCPLLSLPLIFGTTLSNIPADVPYIKPEPELLEKWANRLGPRGSARRIGLAWAGSPLHRYDARRSIPLAQFVPLASLANVEFHSLQKGPAADQAAKPPPGLRLIDHAAELNDFADTAALIQQLDLVISVDTAVAHLAGAIAKPVWTLISTASDWRWLTEHTDSPWYPTMRLFRQVVAEDWRIPIQRVVESLPQFLKGA